MILLSDLSFAESRAVELVGEIATEVDRRESGDPDLQSALGNARVRAVRTIFSEAANRKFTELQRSHEVFIALEAYRDEGRGNRTQSGDIPLSDAQHPLPSLPREGDDQLGLYGEPGPGGILRDFDLQQIVDRELSRRAADDWSLFRF